MIVFGDAQKSTSFLNSYFESVKAVNIKEVVVNFNFLFHKFISLVIKEMNFWREDFFFTKFSRSFVIFVQEKFSLKHERGRKPNGVLSVEFITAEKEPVVSINSVKSNNISTSIVAKTLRYKYNSFAELKTW